MGEITYSKFIKELDKKLAAYFQFQSDYIHCQKGCSLCCEKGDYPLSDIELQYLMQGYSSVDYVTRVKIQQNILNIEKGGKCPFLIKHCCSVYEYRPIICRVHGLAYICKDKTAKVPYCVYSNLNYAKVYKNRLLQIEPIKENLDTRNLLKEFEFGEIRNLYDWIRSN